jgi:hypothetical protein
VQPLTVRADDAIEKPPVARTGRRVTRKRGPNDERAAVVRNVAPDVVTRPSSPAANSSKRPSTRSGCAR